MVDFTGICGASVIRSVSNAKALSQKIPIALALLHGKRRACRINPFNVDFAQPARAGLQVRSSEELACIRCAAPRSFSWCLLWQALRGRS